MTSPFPQITSPPQASAEVLVNEALETLGGLAVYGKDQSNTSGLIWGYYGGIWGGFDIDADTVTLGASTTTYLVVAIATGVLSSSTSTTNWNNDTDYARVYKIVTGTAAVSSVEDHRAGPGGVLGGSGGTGGSGGFSVVTTVSGTSHNIANSEQGLYLRFTNSSAKTCTFRTNATEAIDADAEFHIRCVGTGNLTLTPSGGVTLNPPSGGTLVLSDGMTVTVKRVAINEFDVIGQTVLA